MANDGAPIGPTREASARWTYVALLGVAVVLGIANYLWSERSLPQAPLVHTAVAAAPVPARRAEPPAQDAASLGVTSEAQAKQREILAQAVGMPGDPELGSEYEEINAVSFGGKLPDIPVMWEPALADVGPLMSPGFVLEGLTGNGRILLNENLKMDPRKLRAVLCHEMVHEYFVAAGGPNPDHGPAFQDMLQRLSVEGAFEGVPASEAEKTALRALLEVEASRLNKENAELAIVRGQLTRANPDAPNLAARVAEFNARITRANEDADRFNREAARYNLMMAYPDGLDAESLVRARSATVQ